MKQTLIYSCYRRLLKGKVVSKWCNRRTSEKALSVLKEWIELYGKPMKVMHDGGREFTSNKFKNYLVLNGIIDKQIPKGYPQEQGKVEDVQQNSHS